MSDNHLLREFIERQLQERSMSAREFARFVGVASSTISRAMSYEKNSDPSIEFLIKLSRATATDICEIIYLIYPDTRPNRRPEVTRLADEIAAVETEIAQITRRRGLHVRTETDSVRALDQIKSLSLAVFWSQPEVTINQTLYALLGDRKLSVQDGEITGVVMPDSP